MAKPTTSRSRVANNKSRPAGFRFHWWMALLLVVVVTVVGVLVIRFSRASRLDSLVLRNPYEAHNYGAAALDENGTHHFFWCGWNTYLDKDGKPAQEEVIYYQQQESFKGQTSQAYPTLNSRKKSGNWENGSHMCDPTIVMGKFRYRNQTFKYALYYDSDPDNSSRRTKIGVAFTNYLSPEPSNPTNWTFVDHPIVCEYGPNKDFYGVGTSSAIVDPTDPSKVQLFFVDTSRTSASLPNNKRSEGYVVTGTNGYDFGWSGNCNLASNAPKPRPINTNNLNTTAYGDFSYDQQNRWYYGVIADGGAVRQPIRGPGDPELDQGFYSEAYQQIVARIRPEALTDPSRGGWQILGRINSDTTKSSLNFNPGILRNGDGYLDGVSELRNGVRELYLWITQIVPEQLASNSTTANNDSGLSTSEIRHTKIKPMIWDPGMVPLVRYVDTITSEHATTQNTKPKASYKFDNQTYWVLPDPNGMAGWQPIYSCVTDGPYDYFLSVHTNCDGFLQLGLVGYSFAGSNPPKIPGKWVRLYRCWNINGQGVGENFMTIDPKCEGNSNPVDSSYGWVSLENRDIY